MATNIWMGVVILVMAFFIGSAYVGYARDSKENSGEKNEKD